MKLLTIQNIIPLCRLLRERSFHSCITYGVPRRNIQWKQEQVSSALLFRIRSYSSSICIVYPELPLTCRILLRGLWPDGKVRCISAYVVAAYTIGTSPPFSGTFPKARSILSRDPCHSRIHQRCAPATARSERHTSTPC